MKHTYAFYLPQNKGSTIACTIIGLILTALVSGVLMSGGAQAGECLDSQGVVLAVDSKGMTPAVDCNDYLEKLYTSCPDLNQIRVAPGGVCVPLVSFRRPLMGCSATSCEEVHPYAGYMPYFVEKNTDAFRIEGDLGSDTVIIFLQGGPSPEFDDRYLQFFESGFLVAYVAQTNLLKPELLGAYDLTLEEARREQAENVDLVWKTYQAIRDAFPDKKIALMGHSMGAYLVQATLATYGNPFDRVVIMAGRLDTPLDFARRFSIGENLIYDSIGDMETYMVENGFQTLKTFGSYFVGDYSPTADFVLLGAVGMPRYTKLLENVDLTNVLYVYSDKDEQVGGLSDAEVGYLERKGALVENVGWDIENLGHSRMLAHLVFLERIANFVQPGIR